MREESQIKESGEKPSEPEYEPATNTTHL